MSDRRCPHCGALVGAEAEWCGQCLRPLHAGPEPEAPPGDGAGVRGPDEEPIGPPPTPGEPEPSVEGPGTGTPVERPDGEPAGEAEGEPRRVRRGAFQQVGDRMVWTCPKCELENPLEASICDRCKTPFADLFREPEQRPEVPATRAAGLSLLFPGVGHMATGQIAEGAARAILFAWLLASTIGLVFVRRGGSSGIALPFLLLYALATVALYVVSAVDAHRAAESISPMAPIRILFYVASGLMAVTAAVLLFSGITRNG